LRSRSRSESCGLRNPKADSLPSSILKILERIPTKRRILLLLDYDGTLVPFVSPPKKSLLPKDVRCVLSRLASSQRFTVGILSGRSLKDIRSIIGLKRIYYAGNHGLETFGPGLRFCHQEAAALRPALRVLRNDLAKACKGIHGIFLEDKGLSLSLYYGNMPRAETNRLGKAVRLVQKKYRGSPIVWKRGKKIWNIVLTKSWNKGKTVILLLKHLKYPFPIAIGDDRTDWDMFRALSHTGVTIQVGMLKNSGAQYRLKSPAEVVLLLKNL